MQIFIVLQQEVFSPLDFIRLRDDRKASCIQQRRIIRKHDMCSSLYKHQVAQARRQPSQNLGVDKERKCRELKTETFCNPITVQLLPAPVYNTRDNDIGSEKVHTRLTFGVPHSRGHGVYCIVG